MGMYMSWFDVNLQVGWLDGDFIMEYGLDIATLNVK